MSKKGKRRKYWARLRELESQLKRRQDAYIEKSRELSMLRESHRLGVKLQDIRKASSRLGGVVQRKPHPIYDSPRWRALRLDALALAGGRCCLCGRGAKDGAVLHVDHIKPISRYPALTWEPSNLQVLCADCNLGKSDRYDTDWR